MSVVLQWRWPWNKDGSLRSGTKSVLHIFLRRSDGTSLTTKPLAKYDGTGHRKDENKSEVFWGLLDRKVMYAMQHDGNMDAYHSVSATKVFKKQWMDDVVQRQQHELSDKLNNAAPALTPYLKALKLCLISSVRFSAVQ